MFTLNFVLTSLQKKIVFRHVTGRAVWDSKTRLICGKRKTEICHRRRFSRPHSEMVVRVAIFEQCFNNPNYDQILLMTNRRAPEETT